MGHRVGAGRTHLHQYVDGAGTDHLDLRPPAGRTRSDLGVHLPHARGTSAPQCAGVRLGAGDHRHHRHCPAITVLRLHPSSTFAASAGNLLRRVRKSRVCLRAAHRVEPRVAVDRTSLVAPAGDCRSGGAGAQALPAHPVLHVIGAGNAGAGEQCHRHEQPDRDCRTRGHFDRGAGDRDGPVVARRQSAQGAGRG
ncbi:hypothetical protein D3C81_1484090 [compost metagenome]